jgi:hypothetical protein
MAHAGLNGKVFTKVSFDGFGLCRRLYNYKITVTHDTSVVLKKSGQSKAVEGQIDKLIKIINTV